MKIKKFENSIEAFSLVELMISLITISLIAAAFAPVITKKLSHGTITVGSFGGSSGIIETSTAPQSQKDCNTVGAQLVYIETDSTQKTGLCVTQYNIGDGNFSIPTGSIDENIEAGTSKPDGYCNDKKCCWHGATSGTNCDSVNGSYSGCNRTVCNWEAANSICDNLSYGGYSNWRLPTKEELEKMNPDTYSKIGSEHSGDGGLMFCDYYAGKNSSHCGPSFFCYAGYNNYCGTDTYWGSSENDTSKAYVRYLNNGVWVNSSEYKTHGYSTRCVLGAITVKTISDTACSNGSFLNDDSACVSCTIHSPKCTSCTKDFCSACADGWKVSASGGCEDPNKKSCTITFGEAGDKQFTIPSDVDSMEVTLVSGGNGGNGGSGTLMTHTFSTKTAVSSPTNTNLATVLATGIIDWTIPQEVKSKNVLINACGGGGGGGGCGGAELASRGSNGGRGGYVLNQVLQMPVQNTIKINIGGGGGHGANDDTNNCGAGGYSYAGGGGASNSGYCRPSGSSNTVGQGGTAAYNWSTGSNGYAGYDYYEYNFSTLGITNYGKGGADGGAGYRGGSGGTGGIVGGAGGGGSSAGAGGGGGSATLFLEENLIINSHYVASGGGGGAGGGYHNGDKTSSGGGGGAGGGINGGNGAHGGYTYSNYYLTDGANGADIGSGTPPFDTTNFCAGGVLGTTATDGKPGIMIIKYIGSNMGGAGGGSGAIVPMQTVDLTTNDYISAGEVLKIHVGAGGTGGSAPTGIASNGSYSITAGAGSQGGETYISNNSNVKILATKGMQSGSSAGYITNGKNSTQISVKNFSSSDGSANNNKAGGNGGTIILNGEEFTGGAGATTTANGTSASTGNYGTGGGGGYGAMDGGAGADGYAKIKFMTAEANCTAAKAEIAYNDFIENKNNIFMKIKLALIQFKDFIVALFNPTIKCKTCMK